MQRQGRETQSRLQVYNYALIHDVSNCVPPVGLVCASLQSGEQREDISGGMEQLTITASCLLYIHAFADRSYIMYAENI